MMWIFFIALPGTVFGLNLFLARAAWRLFAPRKKLQIAGTSAVLLALFLLVSAFVGFLLREQSRPFFAFAWDFLAFAVVPMIYLALWAVAGTLAAKIFPKLARFKYVFAGTGVALVAAVCVHGYWKFEHPRVTRLAWDTALRRVFFSDDEPAPDSPRKMRIAATADWHLGTRVTRSRAENFVRLVNAQNPDLTLVAGDLIDAGLAPVEAEKTDEALREIRSPHGVIATLGNHEYYGELDRDKNFIRRANIRLLQDAAALVEINGAKIVFVGRDDATNRSRASADELISSAKLAGVPVFVLDHQPKDVPALAAVGADFIFCGHTHAGQLWPATWLVRAFHRYVSGLYRADGANVFVTSGIGLWHIPYRVGCSSELVVIDVY